MATAPEQPCPLIGTWRLLGMYKKTDDGGREPPGPGWERAQGFLTYTPEGRMFALLGRADRAEIGFPDIDDAKRIDAHKSMAAYTGKYEFLGDHVLHHVDVAWIPDWQNKPQRREVELAGDRLTLTTPFGRRPDGSMASYVVEWQREG